MRADSRLMGRVRDGRSKQRPAWRLLQVSALSAALATGVAIVMADPVSPVTINDVDSPDPVASGGQLTHTITVVNTGGAKINNVVLSDQLNGVGGIGVPPQLQLASSRGSCQQSGNLVTCNAGTIEGNGTWIVSIRGIVTAPNGSVLNNTVSVTGTKSAQNFTTTNTVTTNVSNGGGALPDLSINKTGPTSVPVNSPMTYTLTVNNGGTQNATDIKVVDTVPADLTILSVTGTSLFTCPPPYTDNTVTCTGGAVNAGSNATITINATTPPVVPATPTITNTAVVDPENSIPESNELNNTSALVNTLITPAATTPPLSVDITDKDSEMTGAGPDPVMPGQLETFKILATNNAATRADDVVIVLGTQYLEAASILASQVVTDGAIGNTGGCFINAPQARCQVRSLNPGGTILMTVQGYVIGSAGSFMSSTATVTGNIKNQGVTSQDTELTTVMPQYDLTITKSDFPDPVCASSYPGPGFLAGPPGNEYPAGNVCQGGLTYTFVVGNSGLFQANNVVVRDPLPAGMIFDHVGINEAGFSCAYDTLTNVVLCSGGTIPGQSTKTLQFVTVAPPGIGQISNTVTVDPFNAIFEGDDTNNTFTQTTQVATGIDLTVVKHSNHEADFVATRGTLTYTIKVTNLGTQDATNILVRDILPADTLFRDAVADPAHGFTCSQAGGIVDCTNGHIQGTKSMNYPSLVTQNVDVATITIRIFATPYEQPAMHNEVRVDPLGQIPEANEGNNFAVQNTEVRHGGVGNDAFNELTISKEQTSPNKFNTARNAVVTYEVKVGNDGTDPVVGVKVRDTLPAGFRYIQATGTNSFLCTQQVIGFVDCVGGQIPANTNVASLTAAKITIKAFAADTPGTYTNQAEADPDHTIAEGDEFNNNDSEDTVVVNGGEGAFNDLTIVKTGTGNTQPGGSITYNLQVSNGGSDPALNVAVRDVLPTGEVFVSAADAGAGPGAAFTCSQSSGIVDCIGATIINGAANFRTITIKATAPQQVVPAPGLHNTAVVDPDNTVPEGNEFNNTSSADTTVTPFINLTVHKDGPTTATQSEETDYTIKVTNNGVNGGGQAALGVRMHDPLPVGLIPLTVDAGADNNWACQITGNAINVVDCLGDLGAPADGGNEVTITIHVFVTAESGPMDNVACVDPENTITESDELDNCSDHGSFVAPPTPKSPDILVSKSVDAAATTPGADLTYTVTISNVGTAKAKGWNGVEGLTLSDTLSNQLTFTNFSTTNGWTCTDSTVLMVTTVTCHDNGSGMDVGGSAQVTILAHVKDTANVPISNTATAQLAIVDPSCSDPAGCENEVSPGHIANNSSTVVTSIGSTGFDLSIGPIADAPDPVNPGQGLKYTVVGVNGGTSTATGVHINITIPTAGVSYQGAAGSNGFVCEAPVSNLVDCHGNLPGGGNTTITVSFVTLLSSLPSSVTLSAEIDPADAFPETNEGNNIQSQVTTINTGGGCTTCVDLVAAELTTTPDPLSSGGGATVQFQVVNVGDLPTTLNPLADTLLSLTVLTDGAIDPISAITSTDPAVTCAVDSSGSNFAVVKCKGNLGPAQGVTITVAVPNVSTSEFFAIGEADPTFPPAGGLVVEFSESNNTLVESTVIF